MENVGNVGRDLFQRLQHLADDRELNCAKAGHVAAGASRASRIAPFDRVGGAGRDNRNRAGQLHQDRNNASAGGKDHIRVKFDKVRGCGANEVHVVAGPALVELSVYAGGPPTFAQFLAKGAHPLALLRTRRERPRHCRAAEQRNELAAPHVEHRASSPPWRCRSVYLSLNLPQRGRQVLGDDLNCSESRRGALCGPRACRHTMRQEAAALRDFSPVYVRSGSIAVIAPRRRPCPLLFAGPAAPDRGSQRGRNDCASSCLTSAARDGGTGAASASYWSLNERPIAATPTCTSAAGALLGVAQVTICRRIQ